MAGLNTLVRKTARPMKRVGRGQSSGRGKTSGRGTKGQSARAGNKRRPEMRDIIKKIPKLRGHGKNRGKTYVPRTKVALTLERIEKLFDAGAEVSMKTLVAKGIVKAGRLVSVKIVGGGTLAKKLSFHVPVSASARTAIEKAGGSIA